jgi:hypothetical protein
MNKVKNILLNHFNEYAYKTNQTLFKDILLIILGYCTPYFELLDISFNKQFNKQVYKNKYMVKKLTHDRFITCSANDTIYIWNIVDQNPIIKYSTEKIIAKNIINEKLNRVTININSDPIVVLIHQIDDDTILYKLKNYPYIIIWNFKNNTEESILHACVDNIILLNSNFIAYVGEHIIYIINLKTKARTQFKCDAIDNASSIYITLINNYVLINMSKVIKVSIYKYDVVTSTIMINKNVFINQLDEHVSYELLHHNTSISMDVPYYCSLKNHNYNNFFSIKIIPCVNNTIDCSNKISNNNCIIIETFKSFTSTNYYTLAIEQNINIISVYNVITKKSIGIIQNIIGLIDSVVYLNNGYFAILIEGDIMVYHIPMRMHIQTITCSVNKFMMLESLNGKIITVDYDSNIRIYE